MSPDQRAVTRRRPAVWLGVAALAVVLVPLAAVVAFAILAPYASISIPERCSGSVALLPPGHKGTVPGVGTGFRLADDGDTSVVVVPSGGLIPSGSTAYIVDTRADRIVLSVPIASAAVAAAVAGDAVYLFADKLGRLIRASDGSPLSRFIESDNYRGLIASGGGRSIQTDAWVWILGGDSGPLSIRHVEFTSIVEGCLIP